MDRLSALEVFVKVIEEGSFTRASQVLSVSKSHVSKQVRRLEDRLGARLINRTTRKVSPTDAGRAFYERCVRILEDLNEAERAVGEMQSMPAGTLRMNVPVSFGIRFLGPAVGAFMNKHPSLQVDMRLNDRRVDIVEEGYDLAIRVGNLASSSLIARRLAWSRMVLCGAPSYLSRRGRPTHPQELRDHDCLLYHYLSTGSSWHFAGPEDMVVRVDGRMTSDNGDAMVAAAVAGVGLVLLPEFLVVDHVRSGQLEALLPMWTGQQLGVWAIYPHSRHLSAKVRLFIDFLVDRFSPPPWDCALTE